MKPIVHKQSPTKEMLRSVNNAERAAQLGGALFTFYPEGGYPSIEIRGLGEGIGLGTPRIYDEKIPSHALADNQMLDAITGFGVRIGADRYVETQSSRVLPSGVLKSIRTEVRTRGKRHPRVVEAKTVATLSDAEGRLLRVIESDNQDVAIKAITLMAKKAKTKYGLRKRRSKPTAENVLRKKPVLSSSIEY